MLHSKLLSDVAADVSVSVCRVELLIQCDAGTYQLQSGQGEFGIQDPGCGSSHCDVIKQPIMATVEVVSLLRQLSVHVCVCIILDVLHW